VANDLVALRTDVSAARARAGAPTRPDGRRGETALEDAAVEFETVLMRQLVSAMRETTTFGGEPSEDQLTSYLIEDTLATHLARSGGVGLAELVVRDALGPPSPASEGPLPAPPETDVFAPPEALEAHRPAVLDPAAPGDADPRTALTPIAAVSAPAPPPTTSAPAPEPRGLASRLPPQSDPWLGRADARAILRQRILTTSSKTLNSD